MPPHPSFTFTPDVRRLSPAQATVGTRLESVSLPQLLIAFFSRDSKGAAAPLRGCSKEQSSFDRPLEVNKDARRTKQSSGLFRAPSINNLQSQATSQMGFAPLNPTKGLFFQMGFAPLNPTKGGHALLLNPPKSAMLSECEGQRSDRVPTCADASAGRRAIR